MPRPCRLLVGWIAVLTLVACLQPMRSPCEADEGAGAAAGPPKPDNLFRDLGLIRPGGTRTEKDFEIATLGGSTFRLVQHRGSVVLLNFWATWCRPCVEEMPSIERLARRLAGAPFVVLAVSGDPNPGSVGPFLAQHHVNLPVGFDPAGELAKAFGVRALPTTVIIDRNGHVVAIAFGPRAWDGKTSIAVMEALMR